VWLHAQAASSYGPSPLAVFGVSRLILACILWSHNGKHTLAGAHTQSSTCLCKAHAFGAERHLCWQLIEREAVGAPEAGLSGHVHHHPVDRLARMC